MLHKALSGLKHTTFPPLKKFPQVMLRNDGQFSLCIPCSDVTAGENVSPLLQPSEEQDACPIVEIRSTTGRQLLGLGFVDARRSVISCFHVTRPCTMLPVIDDHFFTEKIKESFSRRRGLIPPETTAYRAVHGMDDMLPSLKVDHYSASFARIQCDSVVGERLIAIAGEYLREHGAEQLIVQTPSIPSQRIVLAKPSMSELVKNFYQEDSVQYLWDYQGAVEGENVVANDGSDRSLLNLAFRRARLMIRNISNGKRCLCINDTAAGMTLNACLSAKHVVLVEENPGYRNWVRQIIVFNHGPTLIGSVVSIHSSLNAVLGGNATEAPSPASLFDVVTVEVHRLVGGDFLQRIVCAVAPRGMLVVQLAGNPSDAASLVRSIGEASMQQGKLSYVVNKFSSASLDFPRHTLHGGVPSCSDDVHHTVFTFLFD